MDFNAQFIGLKEIEKTFSKLPGTSRKVYMRALRSGAKIIRDSAESNLKSIATRGYATGTAEKNIRVYNLRKYRGSYRVGVQVRRESVNTKKIVNGEPVRIGLYASVLEYGKEGQQPQSWIRKAIRENPSSVYYEVARDLRLGMTQAILEAKR